MQRSQNRIGQTNSSRQGCEIPNTNIHFFPRSNFFKSWNRKCLAMLKVWVLDNLFLTLYAERGSVMRCSTICFGLKDFTHGPHMNRQKQFRKLLYVFVKILDRKVRNSRSQRLHEHESLALGSPPFSYFHSFIFLNYCYWVYGNTLFWVFSPDCSFKVVRSLQSLPSVSV